MAYNKENVVHCLGILYWTVAHIPDQEVSPEEKAEMSEKLTEWLRAFNWDVNEDGVIDNDDAANIFLGDVIPFYNEISTGELVEEIHRICDYLVSLPLWNEDFSKKIIGDLASVAMADNRLLQSGVNIVEMVAEGLGIRENVSSILDEMNELAVEK